MLTSLLRRGFVTTSRSAVGITSRNVHSVTFRGPVSSANSLYNGAFSKSPLQHNYKSGNACLENYSPFLLPSSLSNILVRGLKTPLKKPKTKLKTKKAAQKRFILTGRGKLKRNHAGKVRNDGCANECGDFFCRHDLLPRYLLFSLCM